MTSVIERIASLVDGLAGGRVLVAIDGPDAAGKTTMRRELAAHVRRPVVSASIDGWHNPRQVRLQRGSLSPEGYLLDSFNLAALAAECLEPFRTGARAVRTTHFNHRADSQTTAMVSVSDDAALLFDGVFLHRSELIQFWDLRIYLHVPEEVTVARALVRDVELLGGEEQVRKRYAERYLPGQALYRQVAMPLQQADIVIDNSDPEDPRVIRWLDGR